MNTFKATKGDLLCISHFASQDPHREILNGILLEARAGQVRIVGCNGTCLGILSLGNFQVEDFAALIKPDAIASFPAGLKELLQIKVEESQVRLTNRRGSSLVIPRIERAGKPFPDWRKVIPQGKLTELNLLDLNAELLYTFGRAADTLNTGRKSNRGGYIHVRGHYTGCPHEPLSVFFDDLRFYGVIAQCWSGYKYEVPKF